MSRTHQIIQHNSESSLSIADRLTDADRDHERSTVQRQAVRRFVITMFFFFAITAWQSMPSLLQFFYEITPKSSVLIWTKLILYSFYFVYWHLCLWHFDNSYFCCHPQGEYHLLWFILAARKLQSLLFVQLFPHTNSFFCI